MKGERQMPDHSKVIQVQPGSDLDRLLDDVAETPIELEKGGVRYRLNRVDAPGSTKTPPSSDQVARSIAGIQHASGGWKDLVDAEAFTDYIRQRRRTANRPSIEV